MIIANPLYDVVFKYLLEDLEIAKGLFSRIMGVEIETLTKENILLSHTESMPTIRILLDYYKAVVKTENGKTKTVLIELIKARRMFEFIRIKRFLNEAVKKRLWKMYCTFLIKI